MRCYGQLLSSSYNDHVTNEDVRRKGQVAIGEYDELQSNFNGSNSFGTMKICSRQGYFEPMRVDYRARSGGIIGI